MSNAETLYQPYRKYPELFGREFLESWVPSDTMELVKEFEKMYKNQKKSVEDSKTNDDTTEDVLSDKELQKIRSSLPSLRIESDGVYSFNCLSEEFLTIFNEEIENFYKISEEHNIPVRRPNSSE